jgi:transposase
MNRIHGIARDQIEFYCLNDLITRENSVRVIDAFVDKPDLNKPGFQTRSLKPKGRPPHEDSIFMKICLCNCSTSMLIHHQWSY